MAVLQNGGNAEVQGSHLVVSRPHKFDDEGRHAPTKAEHKVVRVRLDEVEDVTFVRATRLDDPGAVVVTVAGNELVLRMLEGDGLALVRDIREHKTVHLTDSDAASANEE